MKGKTAVKNSNLQVNIFPDEGYQPGDWLQDHGTANIEHAQFAIAMSDGLTNNLSRERLLERIAYISKAKDPEVALREVLDEARGNMDKHDKSLKSAHPDDVSASFCLFERTRENGGSWSQNAISSRCSSIRGRTCPSKEERFQKVQLLARSIGQEYDAISAEVRALGVDPNSDILARARQYVRGAHELVEAFPGENPGFWKYAHETLSASLLKMQGEIRENALKAAGRAAPTDAVIVSGGPPAVSPDIQLEAPAAEAEQPVVDQGDQMDAPFSKKLT